MDPDPAQRRSTSNTFELEEHKSSEIIKSSGKISDEENNGDDESSPSAQVKHDFQKKQVSRQNLHSNLYPAQGTSAKHIWSTQKEISRHIPQFFESQQKTQSKLSGTLGISYNGDSLNANLTQHLKRQMSRQNRKSGYTSGAKSQSKNKLFSMRKQAKLSQKNADQNSRRQDSKVLSGSGLKTPLIQKNTKFLIDRAKLSKEDFSFPGQKLASLFEMRKQQSSKKSLLEKKIIMQARLDRNGKSNKQMRCERQNSIFEEAQAKFEQNSSSTRAALLLQKIVAKDKSPLSRLGAKIKTGQRSRPKKTGKFKMKRTHTRDFGRGPANDSQSKFMTQRRRASRNESLDLSESMGMTHSKMNSRRADRFFYKKSLKKHDYNREVALKRAKKTRHCSRSTSSKKSRTSEHRKSVSTSRARET